MRKFERVSKEQFLKNSSGFSSRENLEAGYGEIQNPQRATESSAGYDLCTPFGFSLIPGATITIPTGLKVYMEADEVLLINVRSGQGFRYGLRLMNTQGWIDSDYADNEQNEGHILIKFRNEGNFPFQAEAGQAVAQAIFLHYLVTDDDQPGSKARQGGFGSTGQ